MIYVFATVKTKPGMVSRALDFYRALVPQVIANEAGCLEYVPTTDLDLGFPNQTLDSDMIVVTERWMTIKDFRAHLDMPHSIEFRSSIQSILAERITIRITQSAI
jgi:quinol monooxygenase YgiN